MESPRPDLLHLLQLPENMQELSVTEVAIVTEAFKTPAVQKFFRVLYLSSIKEFAVNDCDTEEQQKKLISRFNKLKGIQMVCSHIVNNFGGGIK